MNISLKLPLYLICVVFEATKSTFGMRKAVAYAGVFD